MTTQSHIEHLVRSKLPIAFGKSEFFDPDSFENNLDPLVDYATKVSEPFLRPETIRYQSILLYVSFIFVSINLFSISKVKIGDSFVYADWKLLLFYKFFIATITILFILKSSVDYERAKFTRRKNIQAFPNAVELINDSLIKRDIQNYFWLEIYDAIGHAYEPYSNAIAESINKPLDFNYIRTNSYLLDIDTLRNIPEFALDIEANEKLVAELVTELEKDVGRFKERTKRILSERQAALNNHLMSPYDSSLNEIYNAFNQCLKSWFDARSNLEHESRLAQFNHIVNSPEALGFEKIKKIINRIMIIRHFYTAIEVIFPILFAVIVLVVYAS